MLKTKFKTKIHLLFVKMLSITFFKHSKLIVTTRSGYFLHHTPKLGIPIEMTQFHLKLLWKQRILLCTTIYINC